MQSVELKVGSYLNTNKETTPGKGIDKLFKWTKMVRTQAYGQHTNKGD